MPYNVHDTHEGTTVNSRRRILPNGISRRGHAFERSCLQGQQPPSGQQRRPSLQELRRRSSRGAQRIQVVHIHSETELAGAGNAHTGISALCEEVARRRLGGPTPRGTRHSRAGQGAPSSAPRKEPQAGRPTTTSETGVMSCINTSARPRPRSRPRATRARTMRKTPKES